MFALDHTGTAHAGAIHSVLPGATTLDPLTAMVPGLSVGAVLQLAAMAATWTTSLPGSPPRSACLTTVVPLRVVTVMSPHLSPSMRTMRRTSGAQSVAAHDSSGISGS